MDEVQSKHRKKGLVNFTQFCDHRLVDTLNDWDGKLKFSSQR